MFDHRSKEPLLLPAAEKEIESFEARVLRELAAIGERLAKLEAEIATQRLMPSSYPVYIPLPAPSPGWPPQPFQPVMPTLPWFPSPGPIWNS